MINNVDVALETDPAKIKDALVQLWAYSPVRWVETVQKILLGAGAVAECGPGKVLAGLTKRCSDSLNGIALADLASIEAVISSLE